MESLPKAGPADSQISHSPADLTSSSGPPSAASTRETSPASSTHRITSTASSSSPKTLPSTSSDRKLPIMDSSQDQSVAGKKGLRDDEGGMMDNHVTGQQTDGSPSLSHSEVCSKTNHRVGHTTSQWQNLAVHKMIAVEGSGRAGRKSRIAFNHQNTEAARKFGTTVGLSNKHNTPGGGSPGNLEEPCNVVDQVGADARGIESSCGDLHVLRGQEARHLQDTLENTLAARSLSNGHQQILGTVEKIGFGLQGPADTLRAETLCNTPPGTHNRKGGDQGIPPDWSFPKPPNAYSSEKGHSALRVAWTPYNANASENGTAAQDHFYAPANVFDAVEENHLRHQGLLAAHSLHDGYGNVLVPRNLYNCFTNNLPMQDLYHGPGPANVHDAGGQGQTLDHSHKGILAAQYCHNADTDTGDAGEHGYPLPQGSLLAQNFEGHQESMMEARGLQDAPPNIYNARGHRCPTPRKLYDALGNSSSPQKFHHNTHPDVFDNPAQPPIKTGPSGRVIRCLPTLHNSSTTSTPSASANQATLHHQNHHHSNNFSARTTSGFSSPASSIFSSNAPSVGPTPYVSITTPSPANPLRNIANNSTASSRRFEPLTGPLPSIDSSISSISTASSSSSNTYIATMFPPRGIIISDADMERAMAYCFDRGNGQYTRLVPVDILPFSLRDIPARVSSDEGMIVLPVPRMVGRDGQPANVQLIPHVTGNNVTPPVSPTGTAQGGSTDFIQNRIDNIVAAAPNATSGPVVLTRSSAPVNGTGRREKVYCDKWIHDGTCAFTQQGCKFRHEMPMDKETQQSLGLFHGLPAWYRKQETERVMHLDDRPVPLGGGAVGYYGVGTTGSRFGNNGGAFGAGVGAASCAQSWRRIEAVPPTPGATAADEGSSPLSGDSGSRGSYGRGRSSSRVANYRTTNNFGPIAPPSQSTGTLSGGLGGNRRRVNTATSFDLIPDRGTSGREAQRDDAAPRGGVRIANNPFDALADYGSVSTTDSDKGKGSDKALD